MCYVTIFFHLDQRFARHVCCATLHSQLTRVRLEGVRVIGVCVCECLNHDHATSLFHSRIAQNMTSLSIVRCACGEWRVFDVCGSRQQKAQTKATPHSHAERAYPTYSSFWRIGPNLTDAMRDASRAVRRACAKLR